MKYLIPVDASNASLAMVEDLRWAMRRGESVEAIVLNVQPRFNRHIGQFTRKVDRDALRAERSHAATALTVERLSKAGIPFRVIAEVGNPAERIAVVATAERVDKVLVGAGRRQLLERYAVPVGIAGLAALILAGE